MKLLHCSDLHGKEKHYARLIGLVADVRPDVVVLGGDMLPDDSALEPEQMGRGQPRFVLRQFKDYILALRKAHSCRAVFVVFGNHDWASSVPAMEGLGQDQLVTVLRHTAGVEVGGITFVGYPCTPPTPWFVKDFERLDLPGDQLPLLGGARWDARFGRPAAHNAQVLFNGTPAIAEELKALHVPGGPWIFVAHAPPFETYLDRTYGHVPWGSRAVRAAIEEHQPMLSLHGHVHESPAVTGRFRDDQGRTVAVNAGQAHYRLNYAVIEVDVAGQQVISIQHGQSVAEV